MTAGGMPCPYPPCFADMKVTVYLAKPGDTVPSLSIVDPHNIVHAGKDTGEVCPVSLMRLPLSQHNRDLLGQRYEVWRKRRPAAEAEGSGSTPLPDHPLTPNPTENNQWFLSGPERSAAAVASAGEVKAEIAHANLALAEGIEHARKAQMAFADAKAILGGVRQETNQELGLLVTGEALTASEDATRFGQAAIELNNAYGHGL